MPVHGTEFLVLILLAFIILGPKQLPEYAAKLARFIVKARRMANDAKVQLKEQMGPEYDDVDWRQYDAFTLSDKPAAASDEPEEQLAMATLPQGTPWDNEAT